MLYVRGPGFHTHLWLLTPASHQGRPWDRVPAIRLGDLGCLPGSGPAPAPSVPGLWEVDQRLGGLSATLGDTGDPGKRVHFHV